MAGRRTNGGPILAIALLLAIPTVRAEVHLRSREGQSRLANRRSPGKSRFSGHSHLILDFREAPTAETARHLAERGLQVVAYLPVTGVIVGFDGEPDLAGLNLAGLDTLQPDDKLSPELGRAPGGRARSASSRSYYVVEFHSDISWEDRRALIAESGLEIGDHRDLVRDHMLVRGTLDQVRTLAEWDEVAYVFPASGELATGLPLIGCLGGATDAGQVGQLTQRVGEGWDGPGLGATNLTYTLQAMTRKIPAEQVQQEIQRAMAEWSSVVKVNFLKGTVTSGSKNINILFGSKEHGDPYAFDGPGRILAHTFYPAPPNPEPIAGDLHFDDDENWNVGADIDLYSVALHELGHALGLGHSDVPNAVMYPYYRRATNLTAEDIGAIRQLYAAAVDVTPAPPPLAPLVLTVTSPASASTTSAATVAVSGSLRGERGAAAVRWSNGPTTGGDAVLTADSSGGFSWLAASVPVALGDNAITLRASDEANRSVSATVQVQRVVPPNPLPPTPNPTPDSPPPTPNPPAPNLELEILSPATSANVAQNPIAAFGTTLGGTGRPIVRWSSDRGFSGTAVITAATDGKYRWDINPLAVQQGVNVITITATDTAGKSQAKSVRVTYAPAPDPKPGDDSRPPTITVTSPNTSFLMTPAYAIAVRGTATDASGVAEVRWECSCGSQGRAQGASQWTIANISLPLGSHTIKIFAKDQVGNEGMVSFTVFRYQN